MLFARFSLFRGLGSTILTLFAFASKMYYLCTTAEDGVAPSSAFFFAGGLFCGLPTGLLPQISVLSPVISVPIAKIFGKYPRRWRGHLWGSQGRSARYGKLNMLKSEGHLCASWQAPQNKNGGSALQVHKSIGRETDDLVTPIENHDRAYEAFYSSNSTVAAPRDAAVPAHVRPHLSAGMPQREPRARASDGRRSRRTDELRRKVFRVSQKSRNFATSGKVAALPVLKKDVYKQHHI